MADENFRKVLEQLNLSEQASQYKGEGYVPRLFEVSSPTSGTQPLWLPRGRPHAKRTGVSGLFMEKGSGLMLSDATIGIRATIRLEKCKK